MKITLQKCHDYYGPAKGVTWLGGWHKGECPDGLTYYVIPKENAERILAIAQWFQKGRTEKNSHHKQAQAIIDILSRRGEENDG